MSFSSNRSSGFRDSSAMKQFFFKDHSPPSSSHSLCQVKKRKKKQDHFLSRGTYSIQLFGSKNNEIICIFNSSSSEYSITLHFSPCYESVLYQSKFLLKTVLKIEREGGNRECKKGCNGYPFPENAVTMIESKEASDSQSSP